MSAVRRLPSAGHEKLVLRAAAPPGRPAIVQHLNQAPCNQIEIKVPGRRASSPLTHHVGGCCPPQHGPPVQDTIEAQKSSGLSLKGRWKPRHSMAYPGTKDQGFWGFSSVPYYLRGLTAAGPPIRSFVHPVLHQSRGMLDDFGPPSRQRGKRPSNPFKIMVPTCLTSSAIYGV